jgi:hypothetical protein
LANFEQLAYLYMNKEKISNWIDRIIQDLTDPHQALEDCLRKTLVLAYDLKNDKLKAWVDCELNGYPTDESLPTNRWVGLEVMGNIVLPRMGGILTKTASLPYQASNHAYFINLKNGYPLKSNVASLELVTKPRASDSVTALSFPINPYALHALNEVVEHWIIEKAWVQISDFTITGLLSQIKTNLLQFLLALNEELGNESNFTVMSNTEKIDRLLERTIGPIHAENLTIGTNYQTKGNQNNVVQGNNNTQQITSPDSLPANIKTLTDQIKELLDKEAQLEPDVKEEISYQLAAVERQAGKEKPKLNLVGKSLQIIETLLMDSASSVYVPLILEGIRHLLPQLAK